jgi:hypothetical protein
MVATHGCLGPMIARDHNEVPKSDCHIMSIIMFQVPCCFSPIGVFIVSVNPRTRHSWYAELCDALRFVPNVTVTQKDWCLCMKDHTAPTFKHVDF